MKSNAKLVFTDWEGPWILTDFAYELTSAYLNSRLYSNISEYDDYLAYTVKMPGYEAGYTVKLVVPFLKAAGIGNREVRAFAEKTASFVPDSKEAMSFLQKFFTPVVISTSYKQFLEVTSEMIGVDGFLHATEVDFDSIKVEDEVARFILSRVDELSSAKGNRLYELLNEFYSAETIKSILEKVRAVGAGEKAKILVEYCEKYGIDVPIAIGDSISDYKMFDAAVNFGGYAVSFNGNEYALRHANVAIVSETAMAEAVAVKILHEKGVEGLRGLEIPKTEIFIMSECDFDEVLQKSNRMRVKLRGDAGRLG